ncbi:MAG: DUF2147 domain-containing protein [Pseudomonadota bacterium]
MKKIRWAPLFCPFFYLLLLHGMVGRQAIASEGIAGMWVPPSGDAVIEIKGVDVLELWLVAQLDPSTDKNNPIPAMRSRDLEGLRLGLGFKRAGDTWKGGQLYDPASGRTYKGHIRRLSVTEIELRGYVGAPMFGRSETWMRLDLFRSRMSLMLTEADAAKAVSQKRLEAVR